jgi:hypothetical protein
MPRPAGSTSWRGFVRSATSPARPDVLDDAVVVVALDHALDFEPLMAGEHDEPSRALADRDLLEATEFKELVAAQPLALAGEDHAMVIASRLDTLVEVAGGRLVNGEAPLRHTAH